MTFEKTALLEKSTFQPPGNVKEFGLWLSEKKIELCESENLGPMQCRSTISRDETYIGKH
jgi:hypothetical protein